MRRAVRPYPSRLDSSCVPALIPLPPPAVNEFRRGQAIATFGAGPLGPLQAAALTQPAPPETYFYRPGYEFFRVAGNVIKRLLQFSEQGAVFGTLTSAQTLARMINYLIANRLLDRGDPAMPYWEGAAIAAMTFALAAFLLVNKRDFTAESTENIVR